jgi:peroxiredoxin
MGRLQELYARYGESDFAVIGINGADTKEIALAFLKENSVTFPNALDDPDRIYRMRGKYETLSGYSGVPLSYLVDREGKVVLAWYGGVDDESTKELEKLGIK